jgi:hypothetical protein
MAHDVFISYSAKNKTTGDAVCAMLESHGIRCWIAPRDVVPGMEWSECIIDAIEEARIMVLIFTAEANDSPQIRREVERAVNHGVAILPLRIENVLPGKALEYFIGNVHWLDALTPPLEAHLQSLAGTIKILRARAESGAPSVTPQEDRPPAGGDHLAEEEAFEDEVRRERAPARHLFWGARAWIWAAGTVSALLLVAVLIGVHFSLHPAPAAAPQAAPDNAASLRETMNTLQSELSSIGSVSYTVFTRMKTNGGSSPVPLVQVVYTDQVSNVVADPAQCSVSFHQRSDGVESDHWFLLHDVTSVRTELDSEYMNDVYAAAGHPEWVAISTTPPVTVLVVRRRDGSGDSFFTDSALASRAYATIAQAVKLCGGRIAR